MWDLPRPGLGPVSPALAGRVLTTAPPGEPNAEVLILSSSCFPLELHLRVFFVFSLTHISVPSSICTCMCEHAHMFQGGEGYSGLCPKGFGSQRIFKYHIIELFSLKRLLLRKANILFQGQWQRKARWINHV